MQVDSDAGVSTQAEAGYGAIPLAPTVTKTGSGTLVFDAVNTYTGPTSILRGMLAITNQAALGTSSLIELASGTALDVEVVADGYTVSSGRTLAGTGTVLGSVTFSGGSTLSPGLSSAASVADMPSSGDPMVTQPQFLVPEPAPLGRVGTGLWLFGLGARRRGRA